MIIFKELQWSDAFSYGSDNTINLQDNPITQLIGKNGHGKTSIALILEEVLFNKNSKGIKKADVINRYTKNKFYTISVTFSKDTNEYEVVTKRGSTQSVILIENGIDISSHTSTATYKQIENILGMDHKTFSQIVCQFGVNSLQFLTDTDTNRKKFLIDLFKLNKYVEIGDSLKAINKEVDTQITTHKTSVQLAEKWIAQINSSDLVKKDLVCVASAPTKLSEQLVELTSQLKSIDTDNKRRITNNQYKKLMDAISVPVNLVKPSGDIKELNNRVAVHKAKILEIDKHLTGLREVGKPCKVCGTILPHDKVDDIIASEEADKESRKKELIDLAKEIAKYTVEEAEYKKGIEAQRNFENYHSLYDSSIPSDLLDKDVIAATITKLQKDINSIENSIRIAEKENREIDQHNAKVDVLTEQLVKFKEQLKEGQLNLAESMAKSARFSTLIKAFSTTGLIAYKLECLVKDLEDQANEYLNDLSSGRFQLVFKINSSDKLNVIITDKGIDVDIAALSNGEKARVNVATLLGIRKLLQSISSTRVNLLFLDETIENLDVEGKERLIEILLQEEHLNTILVSHGFSHPLLSKIHVTKKNNISRIENG